MILIDTNVISELVKPQPSANVQTWFNTQVPSDTCISAITLMEMLDGLGRLPIGAYRTRLDQLVNAIIPRFTCLPFDEFAARSYAQLSEAARRVGHTVALADGQIAAVAHSNGIGTVATRDTGPFLAMGLAVIDPFA